MRCILTLRYVKDEILTTPLDVKFIIIIIIIIRTIMRCILALRHVKNEILTTPLDVKFIIIIISFFKIEFSIL